MPTQHPGLLLILIEELVVHTPTTYPDNEHLVEAWRNMNEVLEYVLKKRQEAEELYMLHQITGEIDNYSGPTLVSKARKLIREDDMIFLQGVSQLPCFFMVANVLKADITATEYPSNAHTNRHVFLFNDLLLLTKYDQKKRLNYKDSFRLWEVSLTAATLQSSVGACDRIRVIANRW